MVKMRNAMLLHNALFGHIFGLMELSYFLVVTIYVLSLSTTMCLLLCGVYAYFWNNQIDAKRDAMQNGSGICPELYSRPG